MGTHPVVAVVGAGASGCLAAAQLARAAGLAGRAVEIVLVDPATIGTGLAYSTPDPRHRLNVAAMGMSAWPEQPQHFVQWLRRTVSPDFPAGGFAPRLHYARYLADVLEQARDEAGDTVRVEHLRVRVRDLRRCGQGVLLTLDDGSVRTVDAVVLALGHGAPSVSWAPRELRRSSRFVADPWRPGPRPAVRAGDHVLLVGAGLTMADMVQTWGHSGVTLHVASRHGMLPLPHAESPSPARLLETLPAGDGPVTLADLRHLVVAHVRRAGGDWRAAIDGLRPATAQLWRRLGEPDRRAFLATASRRWDRVRHRIDPELACRLADMVAAGALVVHAGEVRTAAIAADGVRVALDDGTDRRFAAVVNCTGSCSPIAADVVHDQGPLVRNLLAAGVAQAAPLGLGLATDGTGRVLPARGPAVPIWTLGPLRRGELWESTAIPEIRVQAREVAQAVIGGLGEPAAPDDAAGSARTSSVAIGG